LKKTPLLKVTEKGLYCEDGDFYVDPWRPVDRAVITHGHSDHASWGHRHYLCSVNTAPILRIRLQTTLTIQILPFDEQVDINGIKVSLHPAGHILGSAQVRIERGGEVWVVSGDYKTEADRTAEAFEPVRCNTFITETTFGLPIYKWIPEAEVFQDINLWWARNQEAGKASLIMGYSLGKAQRILSGLEAELGPIFVHGSIKRINEAYLSAGIHLPEAGYTGEVKAGFDYSKAIIVAPPSAQGTPWMRRFGTVSTAFASGWMAVRGNRRRRAADRGFVLSDHVDWPSLLSAVRATGAERILTTHGYGEEVARYFREVGFESEALPTRFIGESLDSSTENLDEEAIA
jgi:putative mRNA 3-end processing factor